MDYQPVEMAENEFNNPLRELTDFFNGCPLHQVRTNLWELYKGWSHYMADYVGADDSREMLAFFMKITQFVNLSYVHVEQEKLKEKYNIN